MKPLATDREFLKAILDDLTRVGVGDEDPVDGSDAGDYLVALRVSLIVYLRKVEQK